MTRLGGNCIWGLVIGSMIELEVNFWHLVNWKRASGFAVGVIALLGLSGCLPGLSLARLVSLGGRGMLVETSAARLALAGRMTTAAGGTEAFASRAISANVGSALLTDARFMSSGARTIPLTISGGGARLNGSIAIDSSGAARVNVGPGQSLRIVRTTAKSGPAGKVAEHFDRSGKLVSYTRYSDNELRFDYYAPVGDGSFQPVLYGLRSPKTGDVTLFGPNHRFLGRAIYRMAVRKLAREAASQTAEQLTNVHIDLTDAPEYGDFRLCSDMYLLLRQTHFQQNWDASTPLQFWTSMYADCPNDNSVIFSYRELLLNDAVATNDETERLKKINKLIEKFPDFDDARLIRERMGVQK
jgi:hypothetical protein